MDIERALVSMTSDLYDPLRGRVVAYDDDPPRLSATAPLYGIVQLLEADWGFIIPGVPTGRLTAHYELTLHGTRATVVAAQAEVPSALTAHYYKDGTTILGSFLAGMRSVSRADVPEGVAESVLQFSCEVL